MNQFYKNVKGFKQFPIKNINFHNDNVALPYK